MNQDIIVQLSNKHNLDRRIIQRIMSSTIAFTVDKMQDSTDTTSIMLRYLGKFKIKSRFKDNKLTSIKNVRSIKA